MTEEEMEKKLQDLIHKSESMMSMVTEHVGTGIVCRMSDEDKKTLVDLIAMCLDYRILYMEEKGKNKELELCLKAEEKYSEGLNRDIKSLLNIEPNDNFISKAKVKEEFEKFTAHNNCFNLGDIQLLLDNILEE